MERPVALKLIGVVLAIYGIDRALLLPAFLAGPPAALLLACILVETIAAFVAAIGLWRDERWAPVATVVLGAAIAATQLVEAAFLGIIALDRAIIVGAAAVLVAIVIALFAARRRIVPA